MSDQRNAYVEQLKTQLDEWNAEIDRMDEAMKAATAELKEEYEKQIQRIYADRDTYQGKLDEVMAASEDAWGDLKSSMEQSWEDMRRGMLKAHSRFKDG